ncbi:MAG TPA: CAP domain-containing protein [Terriglobia bacterium]|nr:CAP domain-containing protein [Terriglobia bacterium]
MRTIKLCGAFVLLAFLGWVSGIAYPGSGQAQTSSKPAPATGNQPGVWHHFGDTPAPAAPGKNTPWPIGSANRLAGMERQLWVMVNHDRLDPANASEIKGGRAGALRWNEKLAEVARAHSRDMMDQKFFDHVDPRGKTPEARIDAAGIPWRAMGENIATNGKGAGDAEAAFMNEPHNKPNHRANILNPDFTEVGIGIVQDQRGRYYITQDFVGMPSAPKTK